MQTGYLRNSLQSALHGVSQYAGSISQSECNRNVIVVTFILRNRHTDLQLEIQQLEGGVRATGLLCLLGVGIGLGSVVIYRLYTTLSTGREAAPEASPPRVLRPLSAEFTCLSPHSDHSDSSLAATPDSGIVADVASRERCSRVCRRYSESGIAARRASGLNQISELFADGENVLLDSLRGEIRRHSSATVQDWLTRVDGSHDDSCLRPCACSSLDNETTCLRHQCSRYVCSDKDGQPSCRSSGFLSAGRGDVDSVSLDLNASECSERQGGFFMSGGVMHRVGSKGFLTRSDGASGGSVDLSMANSLIDSELRRRGLSGRVWRVRRLSFSSQISAGAGSDYSYRESLVSKGFSVDLGEDLLAGMITPPECGEDVRAGSEPWTESGMEKLHEELRMIQSDIDEMNERVGGLQSRDTIFYAIVPSAQPSSCNSSPEDHHTDLMRFSPMKFVVESGGVDEESNRVEELRSVSQSSFCGNNARRSYSTSSDFMWDDLELLDSTGTSISEKSMMRNNIPEHLIERSDKRVVNEINGERNSGPAVDFYIDDDLMAVDLRCSPVDEMMFRDHDLTSSGHIIDWFDVEGDWDCCDSRGESFVKHHQHSAADKSVINTRKLRNSSSDSLENSFRVRRPIRVVSSVDSKLVSTERWYRKLDGQKYFTESTSSPVPSGRSSTGRVCHSSPALISLPPTGSSTPTATVKPLADTTSLPCCHVRVYSTSADVVSRFAVGWTVENIGPRLDAYQRIEREEISQVYRQNYRQMLRSWNKSCVRLIRADRYCFLRAVLYESLIDQIPILSATGSLDSCYQQLSRYMSSAHQYLNEWNFANRLPFAKESIQMKLAECLHALFEQVSAVSSITSSSCREEYLMNLFNLNPETDLRLLEAVKILMMLKAVALYEDFTSGRPVSSFVRYLFTRDTSRSIEQLFSNHINSIGDTSRIGQVEMCLLGHTLGVCIQVARPHCSDVSAELITSYPDRALAERFDVVKIIEENTSGCYSVATTSV